MIIKRKYYDRNSYLSEFVQLLLRTFKIFYQNIKLRQGRSRRYQTAEARFPKLVRDLQGAIICQSCKKCEQICPTTCIEVKKSTKTNSPSSYIVNLSSCTHCGLCEQICPEQAVILSAVNFQNEISNSIDLAKVE